jgi:hypothetical protein
MSSARRSAQRATLIHYFNTYTHITATKAKPFPNGKQADIFLSGITTIDNPTAKDWYIDVTSTNPLGATNQELVHRTALGQQPAASAHDPRNNTLVSAAQAEERKHTKYKQLCTAAGTLFQPFALETAGGHGASTAAVYYLLTNTCVTRGSRRGTRGHGAVAQAQQGISFALRRGTIAQVTTTALDAQRAAERGGKRQFHVIGYEKLEKLVVAGFGGRSVAAPAGLLLAAAAGAAAPAETAAAAKAAAAVDAAEAEAAAGGCCPQLLPAAAASGCCPRLRRGEGQSGTAGRAGRAGRAGGGGCACCLLRLLRPPASARRRGGTLPAPPCALEQRQPGADYFVERPRLGNRALGGAAPRTRVRASDGRAPEARRAVRALAAMLRPRRQALTDGTCAEQVEGGAATARAVTRSLNKHILDSDVVVKSSRRFRCAKGRGGCQGTACDDEKNQPKHRSL